MNTIPAYKDESLCFEERVKDLVSQMTLEEKTTQMLFNSPAIPRLGIPSYNWWNEALHGVARAGIATVFPQAIGMAATFDENLLYEIADVISTEGRAKYHEFQRKDDHDIYKGLTFWSPNINIFRDPRWGRGHETYGEDPYLTSRLGTKFVEGLQGNNSKYLKTAACAKHFAVHSGPEGERHSFNAVASKKDMYETYLPAFKKLVQDANVEAVMGAYNRTNGEPCCGSKTMLKDILRGEWGFKGHVTSDCWAIKDFHEGHMVTKTAPESVALALKNGCDVNCGNMYANLLIAHKEGLISEEDIDRSLTRLVMTRMKLGMFDKPEHVPFSDTPYELNSCREHSDFSVEAAKKVAGAFKE
jgi:beta-glucosidase